MRRHRWALLVALLAVLAACGNGLGRVGDNEWQLVGSTPDERALVIQTDFGGVAAGCARFDGWEVETAEGHVDVRARLWEAIAPSGCTAELVSELHLVELDEPLGDRELRGCQRDDCGEGPSPESLQILPSAGLTDETIAVPWARRVRGFRIDGDPEWFAPVTANRLTGGGSLVVAETREELVGLDAATGDERWRLPGHRLGQLVDDRIFACSGGDSEVLSSIDPGSGELLWSVESGCEPFAVLVDRIVVPTWAENVDGGMRLRIVDRTSGAIVVDRELDDGIDDRVAGIDGAAVLGEQAVLSGPQSDLLVVDANGEEQLRSGVRAGIPLGAVDGVGIFARHDGVIAMNEVGDEVWRAPEHTFATVTVADGQLFSFDPERGVVRRFAAGVSPSDVDDADWSAEVGRSDSWSVRTNADIVVVTTRLAVVVLDAATGDERWWAPILAEQ